MMNSKLWSMVLSGTVAVFLSACASQPNVPQAPVETKAPVKPAVPAVPQSAGTSAGQAALVLSPVQSDTVQSTTIASVAPPADLWERIRAGYAMPQLQDAHVAQFENFYSQRPEYFERMTKRANRYMFYIVEELERRKMPSEIALLPFVESAFNPQAISSAKAAGLWQFMPGTGRDFHLKQNLLRDDRRDIKFSTGAAMDYLQRLYDMFGDWHLALAAYNWGEGNVARAIRKNQAAGLPTGYLDLKMYPETRQYVPKLQAIKNIVSNPERYGVSLPDIGNHPYFDEVDLTRDMDVETAAQLAEVSVDDFKALNPAGKKPILIAAVTPTILLPWDNAVIFRDNLPKFKGKLASWTLWSVPTTQSIAQAAEYADMDADDLRRVNQIPPGMRIQAGTTLIVPRKDAQTEDISEQAVDKAYASFVPEVVQVRSYVVARKRDSIASLAARYGVSASNLANWNGLSMRGKLKAGQTLTIYKLQRVGERSYLKISENRVKSKKTKVEQAKPADNPCVKSSTKKSSKGSKNKKATLATSCKSGVDNGNEDTKNSSAKKGSSQKTASDKSNKKDKSSTSNKTNKSSTTKAESGKKSSNSTKSKDKNKKK